MRRRSCKYNVCDIIRTEIKSLFSEESVDWEQKY
jgi:hypothetical protein